MKIIRLVTIIAVFTFLAMLLIHNLGSINQDIGRHLKSGQIIWESKSVYKTNLFSFTEPNRPFVNHHWLSEVVFFLLYGWVGLKGLIIFKAAVILTAFGFIFKAVHKTAGTGPWIIAMLMGIFVFIERTDVRPEIFSYLFLSYFIFVLCRAKSHLTSSQDVRWLYTLPLVQILWTNMHIYFALGPILLLFFVIDRLIENKTNLKLAMRIFVLVILATLINPNFLQGALLPFNILKDYGYTIVENQSTSFLKDYGISIKQINFFELSLVVWGVSFILALRRGRRRVTFDLLSAVLFSALALKMIRNFAIYALSLIPILALNLKALGIGRRWSDQKKIAGYGIILIILVFLISTIPSNTFYRWWDAGKTFGLDIPSRAAGGVQFVKENQLSGPVFNNFDVGSFLIWKLYPEQKVFIDGRPEAYSADFIANIYKAMQQKPDIWKKYSAQYGINYIFFDHRDITPWAREFMAQIVANPDWPPVYLDDSVLILVKNTPANQKIIEKYFLK